MGQQGGDKSCVTLVIMSGGVPTGPVLQLVVKNDAAYQRFRFGSPAATTTATSMKQQKQSNEHLF